MCLPHRALFRRRLGLGQAGERRRPDAPSGAPANAAPLDRDYPQFATRAIALYEIVAEAFRAAGKDCAQATARLDEFATANRDVVTANRQILTTAPSSGRGREAARRPSPSAQCAMLLKNKP